MRTLRPLLWYLVLLASIATPVAGRSEKLVCSLIVLPTKTVDLRALKAKVKEMVLSDPFAQMLIWEQEGNVPIFRQPREPVAVPYSLVSKNKVRVQISDSAPKELSKWLFVGNKVVYPKHPNNKSETPFLTNLATVGTFQASYTASRSLVKSDRLFSLKMPTDTPHANGSPQPSKTDMYNEIAMSKLMSDHIYRVDEAIGEDPHLRVLKDVGIVSSRQEEETGLVIRDIALLSDGHYYLPAFSIPYVGYEIANLHGIPFEDLWGAAFAERLGQIKAKLILRYGIQKKTPNSQNFLIQLDSYLRPTGVIVVRDLTDAYPVVRYAESLGFSSLVQKVQNLYLDSHLRLKPNWKNSSDWLTIPKDRGAKAIYLKSGAQTVPREIIDRWGARHNAAYKKTLETALETKLPWNLKDDTTTSIDSFLDANPQVLRNYARQKTWKNFKNTW